MADLTACSKSGSSSEKAEAAFQRIQSFLQRNHSPQKFADAQAFRLQQGFLYTTSHQVNAIRGVCSLKDGMIPKVRNDPLRIV